MSQTAQLHLTYGRNNPMRRRVRGTVPIMMIACAAVMAFVPIRRTALDARAYFKGYLARRSAEAKCMAFVAPEGTLIVDERPVRAAEALVVRNAQGESTIRVWNPSDTPAQRATRNAAIAALSHPNDPDCWQQFQTHAFADWGSSGRVRCVSCLRTMASFFAVARAEPVVVMLHARRAPGGPDRLVCLRFDLNAFEYTSSPPFQALVYADGGFRRSLLRWWGGLGDPALRRGAQPLKIYAGEPDPRDESRFTVRFDVGSETHVVEGRLASDDHVTIQVSDPMNLAPPG